MLNEKILTLIILYLKKLPKFRGLKCDPIIMFETVSEYLSAMIEVFT